MNEKSIITRVVLGVALAIVVPTCGLFIWLQLQFPPSEEKPVSVRYLEQYVEVLDVVAAGVLVGIVTVIIPLLIPEARDRFERYKESRRAYSRAKTAVIYLPDRVANAGDTKEAMRLVEQAHRELHYAETFEQVIIGRGYLDWFANPALWLKFNYWKIFAIASVLRRSGPNSLEDRDLVRKRLDEVLDVVDNFFGERGEKRASETWVIEVSAEDTTEVSRFEREDELRDQIEKKIGSVIPRPEPANWQL